MLAPDRAGDLSQRQASIMARARVAGRVAVDELATTFGVTTQTIRRDLNDLSRAGLLARVHGGAALANTVSNVDYTVRRAIAHDGKRAIGERVAAMLPEGCSLILNIGTTTENVARAIGSKRDLVVVTNNIHIAYILAAAPLKELFLAGGVVRQSDGAIIGDEAVAFIRQFKVDYAVIGASALDADGAIMDFDMREVAVARAIVQSARRVLLAVDHSKFERTAPVRICALAEIDVFVTDRPPPRAFAEACAAANVAIEIAGGATTEGDTSD